jgi:tRNA/tmRNA/rRNA uracil-C5-methylase (TrmA/RlmC/RlmD family)
VTLGDLMKMMESGSEPPTDSRSGPKASYLIASAATALKSGQALGAEVLIVDPPRRGLEDEVLDELCKPFNPKQPCVESPTVLTVPDELVNWTNDVQTLIYVSCGFDALARDCDKLLSSRGGWMLESATGYVLFPGSNHVETLCIFKRN